MTTTSTPTETADAVHRWLRTAAQPIHGTDPADTGPDLRTLTDHLATATVVGLGESTRFSRQTYGIRDRILRTLVTEHGFRALAIQDSASSGSRLDAYVRAGSGDPHTALADAWRPLRTAETVATLEWLRAYNLEHPGDQVAVFGIQPTVAESGDYDDVLVYVHRWAPTHATEIAAHLTPIRTAHRIDEHVQRHQGIHPGRPFAEDARAALALLHALPQPADPEGAAAYTTALDRARSIVAFHENSVAGRGGFAGDPDVARTIIDHHRATGARIVYWDGIAHTAGLELGVGAAETRFHSEGTALRAHFGTGYVSVAIGFHHGDLGSVLAPDPAPDLIDADLAIVDLPAYFVDLHGDDVPPEVRAWRAAPARMRVISGIYDPAADEAARLEVRSLAAAFDILVHIRETSPVRWLPEPADG